MPSRTARSKSAIHAAARRQQEVAIAIVPELLLFRRRWIGPTTSVAGTGADRDDGGIRAAVSDEDEALGQHGDARRQRPGCLLRLDRTEDDLLDGDVDLRLRVPGEQRRVEVLGNVAVDDLVSAQRADRRVERRRAAATSAAAPSASQTARQYADAAVDRDRRVRCRYGSSGSRLALAP